jgi:hypothetical protein
LASGSGRVDLSSLARCLVCAPAGGAYHVEDNPDHDEEAYKVDVIHDVRSLEVVRDVSEEETKDDDAIRPARPNLIQFMLHG